MSKVILQQVQLGVEKDLSGGIKIRLGTSMGLLSPEQAVEFAMVLLKAAGIETSIAAQLPMLKQRHFEPG